MKKTFEWTQPVNLQTGQDSTVIAIGDQQQQQQKEWQHMDICPEETETPEKKWNFPDTDSPAKDRFASPGKASKLFIESFIIFTIFILSTLILWD